MKGAQGTDGYFLNVPGSWNREVRRRHPENTKPGHGFATLRLKLLLPPRKDLVMFNAWTASTFVLYCGDKAIAQAGRFAPEPAFSAPFHGPTLVSLSACEVTDLFWQIANFETYFGGPRNGWRLGKDTVLGSELLYRDFQIAGFITLTCFLGICFFVAWLLRRKAWHYFIFSGLSFVAMMLRLSGDKVIQRFFPRKSFRVPDPHGIWSNCLVWSSDFLGVTPAIPASDKPPIRYFYFAASTYGDVFNAADADQSVYSNGTLFDRVLPFIITINHGLFGSADVQKGNKFRNFPGRSRCIGFRGRPRYSCTSGHLGQLEIFRSRVYCSFVQSVTVNDPHFSAINS